MKDDAQLRGNPAAFLESSIKNHVRQSPLNRLEDFGGGPIFDDPLVGFADGDDPIFEQYKSVIGEFHYTPREMLASSAGEQPEPGHHTPESVTVVAIVLPLARWVRESNRKMTDGPSAVWNAARWLGQAYSDDLAASLSSGLREAGFSAVTPEKTPLFHLVDLPDGPSSNWSQRHAAYAAGLGTFSLNDGLITPKGIAVRCCSVVTDLKVPATPRRFANHLANCLYFADGSCRACIDRCRFGALSTDGHDKSRCSETLHVTLKDWLTRPGYMGRYAACGLCQTRVPCESRVPARTAGNTPTPQK